MTPVNLKNGSLHLVHFLNPDVMKTMLITLALTMTLLAAGAAQKDADVQRLEERRLEELQRQKELADEGEKAVAALRAELAGAWTSVIITRVYDCSCTAPSYSGFRLKREGGALTVEPWRENKGRTQMGVPRPITPPEVERLLSETALFYLAAMLSETPWEKAGPMPRDKAKAKEWFERFVADGGSRDGGDQMGMEVRVTTTEGMKRQSSMWALDCPKDFSKWVAAFGTPP